MRHPQGLRRIKEEFDFREELDRLADDCDVISIACITADREGVGLEALPTLSNEMRERLKALAHAYDTRGAKWAKRRRKINRQQRARVAALPLAEGDTLRVFEGPHAGLEAVVTKAYDSGGEVVLRLQPGAGDGAPTEVAPPREVRAELTPAAGGTRRSRADAARSAEAREAVAPLAAVLAGPPPPTVGPPTVGPPEAAPPEAP